MKTFKGQGKFGTAKGFGRGFFVFSFLVLANFFSIPVSARADLSKTLEILGRIPVQSGGRTKPFQSFAKETLLEVTGLTSWEGRSPTEVLWQWMADPEKWNQKPLLAAAYRPLRKEFSSGLAAGRVSPQTVFQEANFIENIRESQQKREKKETLTGLEKERLLIYDKASLFRQIGGGAFPGWIPNPADPQAAWFPLEIFATEEGAQMLQQNYPPEKLMEAHQGLERLIEKFRLDSHSEETTAAAQAFSKALERLFESRGIVIDRTILDREILYLRSNPFGWAWKFYFASFFLAVASAFLKRRGRRGLFESKKIVGLNFAVFLLGFLSHTYGFYLRCTISGRPPVTNMYESLIWVSWAVCFFATVLFLIYKAPMIYTAASAVASLSMGIAESFPTVLDPNISPLVPVLRSNLWLTVHVLTITLSYGAFALAWGIGHVVVATYAFSPEKKERNRTLAQYLYRALQIGVILLASGTVLGGVWANYSWGRFWGWDPKETWALIALLGYLTVLHGRYAGWLGIFGLAVGAVMAFAGVVMAWYGVNFVLAAGLHSYGFGGGGAPYVFSVVLLDMLAVAWLVKIYKSRPAVLKN